MGTAITPGAFRAVYSPAFAAKLSSDGAQLLYSTSLGATGSPATAVDSTGNLLATGWFTPSVYNFPATPDASRPCLNAAQTARKPRWTNYLTRRKACRPR